MNITILVWLGVTIIATILGWIAASNAPYSGGRELAGFIVGLLGAIVTVVLTLVCFSAPTGVDIISYENAQSTRILNKIVVCSESFPTQTVSDMKFIDKELRIKKIQERNAFGIELQFPKYEVEIRPNLEK